MATPEMSRQFDQLFGLDSYFEELQPLAARETLPDWIRLFTEAEGAAKTLHTFQPLLIHRLLQTEDYTREVLRSRQPPEKLEQIVAARMKRQEILDREHPPWLVVLLTEYAVRRVVGGPEIMKAQLQRILDAMQHPSIVVQIIPESTPVYQSGAFTLMGFEEGPDVASAKVAGSQGAAHRAAAAGGRA